MRRGDAPLLPLLLIAAESELLLIYPSLLCYLQWWQLRRQLPDRDSRSDNRATTRPIR
jgi:hypothetical protein